MEDEKLTVDELAEKIKAKYPTYQDMDNAVLVEKIIAKYPVYKEQLIDEQVKKKEGMDSDSGDGLSVSPTTPMPAAIDVQTQASAPTATVATTVKEPEDFSELAIKPDLIKKDEEFVVEQLNYSYGNEGFTFDQAGFGFDKMNVTSANGDEISIDLDAFTTKKNIEEAKKLGEFYP